MKKLITILALVASLVLVMMLASCGQSEIDRAIEEKKAALSATIDTLSAELSRLEGELQELEGEIAALEAENKELQASGVELQETIASLNAKTSELEAEKKALEDEKTTIEEELSKTAKLNCDFGYHVYDTEYEPFYEHDVDTSTLTMSTTARVKCVHGCSYTVTGNVSELGGGDYLGTYGNGIPDHTFHLPEPTSISINVDSPKYNAETNSYAITNDNPLVVTIKGVNLDKLALNANVQFYIKDELSNLLTKELYGNTSTEIVDSETIVFTLNADDLEFWTNDTIFENIVCIGVANLVGKTPNDECYLALNVNVEHGNLEVVDGWMIVNDAEDLNYALLNGGNIKLNADIVSESDFTTEDDIVIDLCGHSITITDSQLNTFRASHNLTLIDNVGGATLSGGIMTYEGNLTIIGDLTITGEGHTIMGNSILDLSGYTGKELYVTTQIFEDIILPENYAFYSEYSNKLATLDESRSEILVYVRPDSPESEWVTVKSADELSYALKGSKKIRLGASIQSTEDFEISHATTIDLAGYDIAISTYDYCTFLVYEDCVIMNSGDNVSTLSNQIAVNSGSLKLVGNVAISYNLDFQFQGIGVLDFTEFQGTELYIYSSNFENILIPDGYAFYDMDGNKLADFAAAKAEGRVYIRPTFA